MVKLKVNPSALKLTAEIPPVSPTVVPPSSVSTKSDASGAPDTASVSRTVIVLLASSVNRDTTVGVSVSITIASGSAPKASAPPRAGKVNTPAFPARSVIVPDSDDVDE